VWTKQGEGSRHGARHPSVRDAATLAGAVPACLGLQPRRRVVD
jgi:hypothetical protein